MKKSNHKIAVKASGASLTLGSLAFAIASAFATPAIAITAPGIDKAPATLGEAQANVSTTPAGSSDTKAMAERDLRSKAMKEAANSYGARSGLLRGNWENREALKKVAPTYDAVFNFSTLMLLDRQPEEKGGDGRTRLIRPPVIVQARNAFNQLDPRMIRERDAVYRIESNVEFAPAPPNWRTYLYRDLGESVASLPHYSLMPRTSEEKAKWDGWVAEGWQAGYLQSKAILESDLNRLARDHDGMILYHDLVAQRVLSLPFVATRNDGVTGDDNNMNVNDVTLRITVIPAFQRKPKTWVTIATDPTPERIGQAREINAERAAAQRQKESITLIQTYPGTKAVGDTPAPDLVVEPPAKPTKAPWFNWMPAPKVEATAVEAKPATEATPVKALSVDPVTKAPAVSSTPVATLSSIDTAEDLGKNYWSSWHRKASE